MRAGPRVPRVFLLEPDAFPERLGPPRPAVVHEPGCARRPCACFGITSEVHERNGVWAVRLLLAEEVVGTCRVMLLGGLMLLVSASTFRASTTEDWAVHHQVVTEVLLRTVVQLADEQGLAVAVSVEEPRELLAELGFTRVGTLMRREAAEGGG